MEDDSKLINDRLDRIEKRIAELRSIAWITALGMGMFCIGALILMAA